MTSTISIEHLSKRYHSANALDDVTIEIGAGVTGLLGPNGAGKTTLLKIVATALAGDAGQLRVLGFDPTISSERTEIRRRLGYLPQDPGMYSGFSGFEMVDYVAVLKEHTIRRERHDEVRRVLAMVGLTDQMHKKIRRLSGGMRRRVALATALLGQPQLLVLDEPAAGLDPDQRLRFREAVSTVARANTVLVSTHQTEEVSALCGRVIVLAEGRIVFAGAPTDLTAKADGRVWLAEEPSGGALRSWLTGDGVYRSIGDPPSGANLAAPTIEDGYLWLTSSPEGVTT